MVGRYGNYLSLSNSVPWTPTIDWCWAYCRGAQWGMYFWELKFLTGRSRNQFFLHPVASGNELTDYCTVNLSKQVPIMCTLRRVASHTTQDKGKDLDKWVLYLYFAGLLPDSLKGGAHSCTRTCLTTWCILVEYVRLDIVQILHHPKLVEPCDYHKHVTGTSGCSIYTL